LEVIVVFDAREVHLLSFGCPSLEEFRLGRILEASSATCRRSGARRRGLA
jgi:hypothetical protein